MEIMWREGRLRDRQADRQDTDLLRDIYGASI